MVALYIIGGILLILLFLLLSSVTVIGTVNENVNIKVGFLCFRKTVVPTDEISKKKKKKSAENDINKPNKIREMIDKNGLVATIRELAETVKVILIRLKKTVKHIRIGKFSCVITVASGDPLKTALLYGETSAVVFPLLRGFQELFKWNDRNTKLLVQSDFCGESSKIELDFKLKLRLVHIVTAAFGVLISLIKAKIKKGIKSNLLIDEIKKGDIKNGRK